MSKKADALCAPVILYGSVLVWMTVIFYLSSTPGSGVAYEMPKVMPLERKGAHVAEYCILTLLLVRMLVVHIPRNFIRALWLSAFLALIYAVSDETHQLFVFGRTGKVTDVLIDGVGIGIAIAFALFYLPKQKSKKILTKFVHILQ